MFGIPPAGPSWSQVCVGDVVECVIVWAWHMIMNHTQTVRRVLCGFASRQYSIALMCLHEHYIFGMKCVNGNTLADLRPAGRCPTADRTLRARNSRMELAELVLCEPRAPVSFIKHLFIFGLFQYAKGWVSWPLPMQIRIGGSARLLRRAFEGEGIPRFSRNEAHSQMGSVRPHSHWKARRTVYLTRRIICPLKSIL